MARGWASGHGIETHGPDAVPSETGPEMMRTNVGPLDVPPVCAGAAEEADMAAETPVSHFCVWSRRMIGLNGHNRSNRASAGWADAAPVAIAIFPGQVTRALRLCWSMRNFRVSMLG